jgi:RNA polymerase sigma-70 factor (ECF subfamily)
MFETDDMAITVYADSVALQLPTCAVNAQNIRLQPTALINEAYLRLAKTAGCGVAKPRGHFLAMAAKMMRHVLIDYAKKRRTVIHGGQIQMIPIDAFIASRYKHPVDFLALDEALTRLEQIDPRESEIVELLFFGGLTEEGAAKAIGISARQVRRDWKHAQARLQSELMMQK